MTGGAGDTDWEKFFSESAKKMLYREKDLCYNLGKHGES